MAERTAHHLRLLPAVLALVALTALAALVATAAPETADARKVAGTSGPNNTIPIRIESRPSGPDATFIRVRRRNNDGSFAGEPVMLDLSEETDPIRLTGTVEGDGDVRFPAGSVSFPTFEYVDGDTQARIFVTANGDWTGTLNPYDGSVSILAPIRIQVIVDSPVGSTCDPVNVTINALITGADPNNTPGPYHANNPEPVTQGSPYVPSTGRMTIIDNDATIPAVSSCSGFITGGIVRDELNSALALPAAQGDSDLNIEAEALSGGGFVRPQPALNAAVSSTQSTTTAYTRNYDASASGFAAGTTGVTIAQYRWDWDNNGTVDETTAGPTVAHNFGSAGAKTIRLTVADSEGDLRTITNTATVAEPPDVSIAKTASDPRFTVGKDAGYTLQVANAAGRGPTVNTTTVTDTIPADLDITGVTAGGSWSCNTVSQTVTCTLPAGLAGGTSAPPITIGVRPRVSGANTSPTNTATANVPADINTSNNSSQLQTPIDAVDLTVDKAAPVAGFTLGTEGDYTITVSNAGTGATFAPVRVIDELPAGLSYRSASVGWSCTTAGQQVECTLAGGIAAGGSATLTLTVFAEPSGEAYPSVTNTARVQTTADIGTGNNEDTEGPTPVAAQPDVEITKTVDGPFRVGTDDEYAINVRNAAPAAATTAIAVGPITVTDTLPAGLTYTGFTGAGWSCSATGQDVECTHPGPLAPQTGAPALAIEVAVDNTAAASVSNTAEVAIPPVNGEVSLENNTSTVTHDVNRVDVQVIKTSDSGFQVGNSGQYTISRAQRRDRGDVRGDHRHRHPAGRPVVQPVRLGRRGLHVRGLRPGRDLHAAGTARRHGARARPARRPDDPCQRRRRRRRHRREHRDGDHRGRRRPGEQLGRRHHAGHLGRPRGHQGAHRRLPRRDERHLVRDGPEHLRAPDDRARDGRRLAAGGRRLRLRRRRRLDVHLRHPDARDLLHVRRRRRRPAARRRVELPDRGLRPGDRADERDEHGHGLDRPGHEPDQRHGDRPDDDQPHRRRDRQVAHGRLPQRRPASGTRSRSTTTGTAATQGHHHGDRPAPGGHDVRRLGRRLWDCSADAVSSSPASTPGRSAPAGARSRSRSTST